MCILILQQGSCTCLCINLGPTPRIRLALSFWLSPGSPGQIQSLPPCFWNLGGKFPGPFIDGTLWGYGFVHSPSWPNTMFSLSSKELETQAQSPDLYSRNKLPWFCMVLCLARLANLPSGWKARHISLHRWILMTVACIVRISKYSWQEIWDPRKKTQKIKRNPSDEVKGRASKNSQLKLEQKDRRNP